MNVLIDVTLNKLLNKHLNCHDFRRREEHVTPVQSYAHGRVVFCYNNIIARSGFKWLIYSYFPGFLNWHMDNCMAAQCQWSNPEGFGLYPQTTGLIFHNVFSF